MAVEVDITKIQCPHAHSSHKPATIYTKVITERISVFPEKHLICCQQPSLLLTLKVSMMPSSTFFYKLHGVGFSTCCPPTHVGLCSHSGFLL